MSRHDQDRVWELIDSIRFAMLVTHDGDGEELRARPMHAHGRREEDTVYFLTDRRHHKDDEIQINDNICMAFADPDGRVRATFCVVWLSGWAPHASQQQPARRGSATVSMARILEERKQR